jgi:hypothetical protein
MGCRRLPVLVLVAAALASAGCGSERSLRWQEAPRTQSNAGQPGGHLLFGTVVNRTNQALALKAGDVRVIDRDGRRLPSAAGFSDGFLPNVVLRGYGTEMFAAEVVGVGAGASARVSPGGRTPLSVSWTVPADGAPAAAIEVGGTRLTLPRTGDGG